MKNFKFLAIILALVLAMGLFACGTTDNPDQPGTGGGISGGIGGGTGGGGGNTDQYTYVDFSTDDQIAITVDGVKNETAYNNIAPYKFGIRSSVKAYFAASKLGFYAFFDVEDTNLFYDTQDIYKGDCVEFYLDPDNRSNANPTKTVRQIQATPSGDYELFKGDVSSTWVSLGKKVGSAQSGLQNSKDSGFQIAVTANGTPVALNSSDPGTKNDTGYSIELFLSWEGMGVDVRTVESNKNGDCGVVGVSFGHRDVMTFAGTRDNYMNDVANAYPQKYHKLKFNGDYKGVSTPTVASEIAVDGVMNETQWQNAVVVGATSVNSASGDATINAKAFFGANGLYVGVEVSGDTKLKAPIFTIGDGVYKNDGCEMRIFTFDAAGNQIRSFKFLYDLFGMCWHDIPQGTPGACDELYAVKVTGTINDDNDIDSGWCMELFIPTYELQADAMVSGNLISSRQVSYARVLVGVQNYYLTHDTSVDPKDQAPEVQLAPTMEWDNVETYARINK